MTLQQLGNLTAVIRFPRIGVRGAQLEQVRIAARLSLAALRVVGVECDCRQGAHAAGRPGRRCPAGTSILPCPAGARHGLELAARRGLVLRGVRDRPSACPPGPQRSATARRRRLHHEVGEAPRLRDWRGTVGLALLDAGTRLVDMRHLVGEEIAPDLPAARRRPSRPARRAPRGQHEPACIRRATRIARAEHDPGRRGDGARPAARRSSRSAPRSPPASPRATGRHRSTARTVRPGDPFATARARFSASRCGRREDPHALAAALQLARLQCRLCRRTGAGKQAANRSASSITSVELRPAGGRVEHAASKMTATITEARDDS